MIKPYIATVDQIKVLLSMTDTTYDSSITTFLPVVTDDLCRTNGICNQSFLFEGTADIDETVILSNVSLSSTEWSDLYIGAVVRISGEDGVIEDYSEADETITLEAALTTTSTDEDLEIRNFPVGAKATASQMVAYKIKQGSINGGLGKEVSSRSAGPLSVSFKGSSSSAASVYGYPEELLNSIRSITKPRFI